VIDALRLFSFLRLFVIKTVIKDGVIKTRQHAKC